MTPRRTFAAAIGTVALAAAAPTAAHAGPSKPLERAYAKAYAKADKHGQPGRNIVDDGVVSSSGKPRSPRAGEVRRSLEVLRRMHPAGGRSAPVAGASAASPQLEAIAACESGGNPAAVDASGTYRGKYQFDTGTWASIGGTGDPAAASEAEQDRRAAALMAQRGSAPWPVCGG